MRWLELFEDGYHRLSMTRLIVLLTWPAATYVLLSDSSQLATYLGIYVGGYALGKATDAFKGNNALDSQQLADSDVGAVSTVTTSTSIVNQPLEKPIKPVRKRKVRPF